MSDMVGVIISAVVVIGSFVALVMKIVKLTAAIKGLLENDKIQDARINKHGCEIDSLNMKMVNHEQRIQDLERR